MWVDEIYGQIIDMDDQEDLYNNDINDDTLRDLAIEDLGRENFYSMTRQEILDSLNVTDDTPLRDFLPNEYISNLRIQYNKNPNDFLYSFTFAMKNNDVGLLRHLYQQQKDKFNQLTTIVSNDLYDAIFKYANTTIISYLFDIAKFHIGMLIEYLVHYKRYDLIDLIVYYLKKNNHSYNDLIWLWFTR